MQDKYYYQRDSDSKWHFVPYCEHLPPRTFTHRDYNYIFEYTPYYNVDEENIHDIQLYTINREDYMDHTIINFSITICKDKNNSTITVNLSEGPRVICTYSLDDKLTEEQIISSVIGIIPVEKKCRCVLL